MLEEKSIPADWVTAAEALTDGELVDGILGVSNRSLQNAGQVCKGFKSWPLQTAAEKEQYHGNKLENAKNIAKELLESAKQ